MMEDEAINDSVELPMFNIREVDYETPRRFEVLELIIEGTAPLVPTTFRKRVCYFPL